MKQFQLLSIFILFLFMACRENKKASGGNSDPIIRFEKINYYAFSDGVVADTVLKTRVTYYFENGKPHRWIERDAKDQQLTDYIYQYNDNWVHTGAIYIEPGEEEYSVEKVSYSTDSLQVTTSWIDSSGQVYYQMVEDLNADKKVYRAAFIGDQLHGYDSTYYTPQGFAERIFFTNTKGKVLNDRQFKYTQINENGDWTERQKIMQDTIREIQRRTISYGDDFISDAGKFYEGVISSGDWNANMLSFNQTEDLLFYTRGNDWKKQLGFIAKKQDGLFLPPEQLKLMDTIYNGAISPSGNQIIYCKRVEEGMEIWLMAKSGKEWQAPVNLTATSGIEGGYFNWVDENEIWFYVPENEGDMVRGKIENGNLRIVMKIEEVNTSEATEFSPFVDPEKRFIIFTRYLEGDTTQQGFFISYNEGDAEEPNWSKAKEIDKLLYGWGAYISKDQKYFYYTDGEDIYARALKTLNLGTETTK